MRADLIQIYRAWLKGLELADLIAEYDMHLLHISQIAGRLRKTGPIVFKRVDEYGPQYMRNNATMTQLIRDEITFRTAQQLEFDFSKREEVCHA